MYRFFADGLCQHVCAGHIPHDEMVIDARRQLAATGHAPKAVEHVKANIQQTGNPWGEREPDLLAMTASKRRADVLVYFGPTARIRRPAAINALTRLLVKAGVAFSVLAEEGDAGLLLHQLGEADAGATAATALASKIAKSGARTVVTPDAGAFQAFKQGFGDVPPLSGLEIRHSSEFLLELTAVLKLCKPTQLQVAYHDPCALARHAPCLEAPRALLAAFSGAPPLEIGIWSRDLANCSGECGGVPFTHPELSKRAAERRIHEACNAGADAIVAGCPAAAAALEGRGLPVWELCEFLAQ
jgi:Fe-S oxidoreductase